MDNNNEVEVPPFFLCPISLEIMKDPVIVSTGITYDRESIEKWLFSGKKNATCPVTKQSISQDTDLITPNHTLRRLIQSWCTVNASYGIERIPTPKSPISRSEIEKLIRDSGFATSSFSYKKLTTCLNRLREILTENGNNRRCLEAAGVPEFLASIIRNDNSGGENGGACDDALSLLYNLQVSENGLKSLLYSKTGNDVVKTLTRIMQNGTYESRTYATLLLESVLAVTDPVQLITLNRELFQELIQIIHNQISIKATKSAFRILISVCPWGRNRHKAVEFGAVRVTIELLLDRKTGSSEKKISEMAMVVLDLLCQCAEGRAELLGHAAGLAVISKKLLRVSHVATERGVRVLVSLAKFCATPFLLEEMLQLGVVAKLCLVIQVECRSKAKDKASELLKLHARVWKNSPCVPKNLIGSYPA